MDYDDPITVEREFKGIIDYKMDGIDPNTLQIDIKHRFQEITNDTTMNEETIYREVTMIYMDSLNPDVPIKLERVLWDGTCQWKFMFQSFNFSTMYREQRSYSINEHTRSVLRGDGHDDVDGDSFLCLGNSDTIDENHDVNLYDKFKVLICGISDDNREHSRYLHENNIKSLYITQIKYTKRNINLVYGG